MQGAIQGEIRNANSGQCLQQTPAAQLQQARCNDSNQQQWLFEPIAPGSHQGYLRDLSASTCVVEQHGQLAMAACAGTRPLDLERIGNTYRIRAGNNQCAHIAERSLDAGAKVRLQRCPPPGRADFHWSFDGLRDQRDYELLFSTTDLKGSVAWARQAPPNFAHPIGAPNAAPLCRGEEQLGLVAEEQCELSSGRRVSRYERLWSNTRLVH